MRHKASAWRITHSLRVSVYKPETSDEDHKTCSSFSLRIEEIEDSVHLRAETDEDIDNC